MLLRPLTRGIATFEAQTRSAPGFLSVMCRDMSPSLFLDISADRRCRVHVAAEAHTLVSGSAAAYGKRIP